MIGKADSAIVVLIQILSGSWRPRELFFLHPEKLALGRHQHETDVLFSPQDQMVSDVHLRLDRHRNGYLLTNESQQGTYRLDAAEPDIHASRSPGTRIDTLILPPGSSVCLRLGVGGPICRLMVGLAIPFGRYQLVGMLGKGGMGEVDLAWERGLNRLVVLKFILPTLSLHADAAEQMLIREARVGAVVPNTLTVYEVQRERGVLYIAMEYLRGITLAELAGQLFRRAWRLPPSLCSALVRQVCLSLHAAHTAMDVGGKHMQIVHRDVSPHNIMLTQEGLVKLIDFGVARTGLALSHDPRVVGNPAYMSPEHINDPQSVDHRADIFSLGIILWELCTGSRLFARDGQIPTFHAVCHDPIPPLQTLCSEAPPALCRIVAQALTRDRAGRQQSTMELALQLQHMESSLGSNFTDPAQIAGFLSQSGIMLMGRLPRPLLDGPDWLQSTDPSPPPLPTEGGTIAAGRYRLLRQLSPARDGGGPRWKLTYLAEKLNAAGAAGERVVAILCGDQDRPYALPEREANRLFEFAEHRRDLPRDSPLSPVLDHGLCWKDGPSYLIVPYYPRTLATRLGTALGGEQKVRLARQLFAALEQALLVDPGYRHGNLKPEHIALLPGGESGERVVLLDLCLPHVLGLGREALASSDVLAMGMTVYRVCGGDGDKAAAAMGRGEPPPPPSLGEDMEPYIADAVFRALKTKPNERPSAADMVRLLHPSLASDEIEVVLPLTRGRQSVRARGQVRVELCHVSMNPFTDREPLPLPLPLPLLPECGAEPLWLYLADRKPELRLAPSLSPERKLQIYREPPGSRTHVVRYEIRQAVAQGQLWIGHHRHQLQKVLYSSAIRVSPTDELLVLVPGLGLRIRAPASAQRLVALYVNDPSRGLVSMVCMTVSAS